MIARGGGKPGGTGFCRIASSIQDWSCWERREAEGKQTDRTKNSKPAQALTTINSPLVLSLDSLENSAEMQAGSLEKDLSNSENREEARLTISFVPRARFRILSDKSFGCHRSDPEVKEVRGEGRKKAYSENWMIAHRRQLRRLVSLSLCNQSFMMTLVWTVFVYVFYVFLALCLAFLLFWYTYLKRRVVLLEDTGESFEQRCRRPFNVSEIPQALDAIVIGLYTSLRLLLVSSPYLLIPLSFATLSGAGLGALSCAGFLSLYDLEFAIPHSIFLFSLCLFSLMRRGGKKVVVLEQHDRIGGCTHTFERQAEGLSFEYDTGLFFCPRFLLAGVPEFVLFALFAAGIHWVGLVAPEEPGRASFDMITDGKLKWNVIQSSSSQDAGSFSSFPKRNHIFDVQISERSFAVSLSVLLFHRFLFASLDVPVPPDYMPASSPISSSAAAVAASALAHSQWASSPFSLPQPRHLASGAVIYPLTDSFTDLYACLCAWFPAEREALYSYFTAVRAAPSQAGGAMFMSFLNNVGLHVVTALTEWCCSLFVWFRFFLRLFVRWFVFHLLPLCGLPFRSWHWRRVLIASASSILIFAFFSPATLVQSAFLRVKLTFQSSTWP